MAVLGLIVSGYRRMSCQTTDHGLREILYQYQLLVPVTRGKQVPLPRVQGIQPIKCLDCAFRCCAPSVWNSLDSRTLHCSSISGFKRRLKTLLFRQTFSSTTWTVRQRLWSHPTCWRYINKIIIIIIKQVPKFHLQGTCLNLEPIWKLGLHRIWLFQIRPKPNLAEFRNSNSAEAEAKSGWNLFSGHRTIRQWQN